MKLNSPTGEAAESFLRLSALLADARQVQWSPGHHPKSREDSGRQASGGHGDPTGDTALDPQRLAVRASVTRAEAALALMLEVMREARQDLEAALTAWEGDPPD